MATSDDNRKWHIPKKYRASLDVSDPDGAAVLADADAKQKEWAKDLSSPFFAGSPANKHRAKAMIEIEALTNIPEDRLTDDSIEILAEKYAVIGRYDLAAQVTKKKASVELYEKYWSAVWLDDSKWCEHPASAKYIREYIFSLKENKDMPLLACNICGTWNVKDAPPELVRARQMRSEVRAAVQGRSPEEVKAYLTQRFRKN